MEKTILKLKHPRIYPLRQELGATENHQILDFIHFSSPISLKYQRRTISKQPKMPDLDEISYPRDASISALSDHYRFLVEMYMGSSEILEPPDEGWPTIPPEFRQLSGKSNEVAGLLRRLPCIRGDMPHRELFPSEGSGHCYWADRQLMADLEGVEAGDVDANIFRENDKALTEGCLDDMQAMLWVSPAGIERI